MKFKSNPMKPQLLNTNQVAHNTLKSSKATNGILFFLNKISLKASLSLTLLLAGGLAQAQNGLENVIVEKYYISDANDTTVNSIGGVLPIGSVTYRIYVDMLPGYKFQAAYGVNTPGAQHELRIATTTLFFNNEDRGATTPTYNKNLAKNNTVMLDSWLSVGAACTNNFGVLKSDDDGVNTNVNNDGVLQNNDPLAGIPLTVQDGLLLGAPQPVTTVGITQEIAMFDAQNDGTNGPVFSTFNGAWSSLVGSEGPDTTNKVLIAQMTTDGEFSFELNLQIGTPVSGISENYVAKNPVGNEILFGALTYNSALGIQKPTSAAASKFKIYPNPTNDFVNVEINATKQGAVNSYTIYDITGKVMIQKSISASTTKQIERVDLSSLSQGLYFIELMLDGAKSTEKVSKY